MPTAAKVALHIVVLALALVAAVQGQSMTGLHVQGNKILNQDGQQIQLRGVDRSGTEFMCVQGRGIFDGPSTQSSVNAIKSWNANSVRLPLNEDCWLGINGINSNYGGRKYQRAIVQFVQLLGQNGLAVILAPGRQQANAQQPMPNTDHSIDVWQSIANTFKNYSYVIFDLFNEPYPNDNAYDSAEAWSCWKNGGNCTGIPFQVAGMQNLVDTVRATGSTNIIMLAGICYSNSLTRWLEYKPTDPLNNLAASWHSYNFNYCSNQGCWDSAIAPVGAQVPLITGELGENDCKTTYITSLLQWLDSHQFSYLAWTWNTWNCNTGPALISSYAGTATGFGVGFKQHLANISTSI